MIILGISALLMLGGCVNKPEPKPEPKPVVKPKAKAKAKPVVKKSKKRKSAYRAPKKHGKVPPLPEREVDVDMDNMVDQAMAEALGDDNTVQKMP